MADKNEKIHQALLFLDKAKAANNDVEKEENLLAYVNAMILIYEEGDVDDEATIKRLISACKQIVKFYDEKEQADKSLPYNRRVNDLSRQMYEKDTQSLDWSVKYSMSILAIAENCFDTENKEEADTYFSTGNKLLAKLKKNYPEDEAVKKALRVRRKVKKKLYPSEEENQEDSTPEIVVADEAVFPEVPETVEEAIVTEESSIPETSAETENVVTEEKTPDQPETVQAPAEISAPEEAEIPEIPALTEEPTIPEESVKPEDPIISENAESPVETFEPLPVPEETPAEEPIHPEEPAIPDQPEPEDQTESLVAEETVDPEKQDVLQNPVSETPPAKEKPAPAAKAKNNQSVAKILIILAFLLIITAFGLFLYYYFSSQTSDTEETAKKDTVEMVEEETMVVPDNDNSLSEEMVPEEVSEPVEIVVQEEIAEPVNLPAPKEEPRTEKPEIPAKPTPKEVQKEPVSKMEKPAITEKVEEPAPKPVPVVSNEPQYVTQRFNNGNQYAGYVDASGKKQGKGTYTWANGDKYVGDFVNDQGTGQGVYYSHEGWRYEGAFKDLKFHGKGTYYFPNGKKKDGVWENGTMK